MDEIFRYLLLVARRDRVVWSLMGMMVMVSLASLVLGHGVMVEERQATTVFVAGGMRFILVVGVVLFTATQLRHMDHSRELAVFISRPITRGQFLIGFYGALCLFAASLCMIAALLVMLVGVPNLGGLVAWWGSLAGELAIMAAAAMAFGLMLKSPVAAALAALGYYFLARIMALLVMTQDSSLAKTNTAMDAAVAWVIRLGGYLVPRLDRFAQSEWLVYSMPSAFEAGLIYGQIGVFSGLFLIMAWLDFSKKEC
jgi:ABC-type transport system involved in multi-copper enzyme maturation permease subunit